jgi:hypothetical protein
VSIEFVIKLDGWPGIGAVSEITNSKKAEPTQ